MIRKAMKRKMYISFRNLFECNISLKKLKKIKFWIRRTK